ncbi:hypothetical protein Tco_0054427 [Tanacetum coccineum]
MGCLPRSACLGSRCLDPSQGFIDTGESLEIWNYKCASTVAVRKYSSDGERAIPNGILGLLEKSLNLELKRRNSITMLKKHGFDLEVLLAIVDMAEKGFHDVAKSATMAEIALHDICSNGKVPVGRNQDWELP